MKKTMKMFSITLMSVAMAICFMFAGAFMAKAATVNDVTLSAEQGAYVLVGGTAEETGIKFDFKVNASEYDALINDNPEATIKLGVLVGKASAGEVTETNFIEAYEVKTGAEGLTEAGEFYNYSFAITYNLEQVFNSLKEAEMLGANLEYADASEDATFNAYVNQMYARELVLRPFVSVDGVKALGTASEARAMLHVAQAEIAANAANLPDGFAEKYIKETIDRTAEGVTVYSDGSLEGIADEIVALTVGTNGKVVGRNATTITEMAVVEQAIVDGKVELYGYGADRTVYKYLATYEEVGGGEEATEITEEVVLSRKDGKIYFNGTSLAGKTASSLLYNGSEIISGGVIDASVISEAQGSAIELEAVIEGNEYVLKNVLFVELAVANTPESRALFAGTFSDGENDTGYYALVENITFDINNGGSTPTTAERFGYYNGSAIVKTNFSGTIDGRGYVLEGVMFVAGKAGGCMFGNPSGDVVVKNIGIINLATTTLNYAGTLKTTSVAPSGGILFYEPQSGSNTTFENIYIDVNTKAKSSVSSSARWSPFFYTINNGASIETNNIYVKVTHASTGNHCNFFASYSGKAWGTAGESDKIKANTFLNNAFFISNAPNNFIYMGGVKTMYGISDFNGTNKAVYTTENDFANDIADGYISIASFDNAYWTITSGVPVWNGLSK